MSKQTHYGTSRRADDQSRAEDDLWTVGAELQGLADGLSGFDDFPGEELQRLFEWVDPFEE